jgi:hypothetical protein
MNDKEILARISGLIETEHELRGQLAAGTLTSDQAHERLRSAEEALDQCWDLLRQRRAKREFGANPDDAAVRPAAEVEGYRQLPVPRQRCHFSQCRCFPEDTGRACLGRVSGTRGAGR